MSQGQVHLLFPPARNPWGPRKAGLGKYKARGAAFQTLPHILATNHSINPGMGKPEKRKNSHKVVALKAKETTKSKRDISLCCHRRIQTA